jgi:nucleotide-binding universal stress UspA family protein
MKKVLKNTINMKTIKMNKVLIALDYYPSAQKVAEVGFTMAKSMGAEIILLHVITDPVYYSSADFSPIMGFSGYRDVFALPLENNDELIKASFTFLDKTKEHLGDKSIQTMVEEGKFGEVILKVAKKEHVDIIIMGSHSQKWLENIVMGSVTEDVLRKTTIPLFIIPVKEHK